MHRRLATVMLAATVAVSAACSQSDAGITTAVKSRLAQDDTVKAYQIDVDTADSVVTLRGTVPSAAAKDQAITLARQTDGVRDVVDQVMIGPDTEATTGAGDTIDRAQASVSDAAITTAIKSKFVADASVSAFKIDVDTNNGVVTLNGTTASRAAADQAIQLARSTDGVTRVVDNLQVNPSSSGQ